VAGENQDYAIVYFDGVCGLCDRFVNYLLRKDARRNRLRFTPLQGSTASVLKLTDEEKMESIVFEANGKIYRRSNAAIRILTSLGGAWSLLWLTMIFPRFLRDFVYNIIATNRYKWFGKHDACRLPSEEEAAKFLP